MNERRYSYCALTLALIAFAFSTSPITMPILSVLFDVRVKGYTSLERILGFLTIFGWIPGLVIALLAYKMGQRMKGSLLLINITRIALALTIIGTLFFGLFLILSLLVRPFAPGW